MELKLQAGDLYVIFSGERIENILHKKDLAKHIYFFLEKSLNFALFLDFTEPFWVFFICWFFFYKY